MRERLRERIRASSRQPGQVLIIVALMIPVMIGAMGIGIDVAYVFKERRQLQNVADLAALGGVGALPDDAANAETIAQQLAVVNGVPVEMVAANAGYNGDDNQLEVSVSRTVELFFMPILGYDSVEISARAVAEHATGTGTAIFAKKDTHCWDQSIYWGGSNIIVDGDAHSNSGVTIPSSATGNTLTGDLTHGISPNGDVCNSSKVRQIGVNPNIPKAQPLAHQAWPVVYSTSDFPCSIKLLDTEWDLSQNGRWWVGNDASNGNLKPGVICYEGSNWLTLKADNVSGTVTFVARNIELTGNNFNLNPYMNDVVIYSTGTAFHNPTTLARAAVTLNVSGGTIAGMIYEKAKDVAEGGNQGGQVRINGSNGFRLNGSIVAWAVRLEGNNWSIVNNLEGLSEPAHLVE